MGADYYANANGDFEIVIRDGRGNELGSIGFEIGPYERVDIDLIEGRPR